MTETVSVFTPSVGLIPLEELYEITGIENIESLTDSSGILTGYQIVWDDVSLLINLLIGEEAEDQINEFQTRVDELLEQRTDKKAKKIWRRAERMVNAITCTVEPEWDEDRKAQHVVQAIMEYYDYALMLADSAIYNENGNTEVGHEESKPKYWAREGEEEIEAGEALERKQRSIKQLKAERIPYIEHLPVIADAENTTLRDTEAICQRAIALNLIARRAEGQTYDWYQQKVQQYAVTEAITPAEEEFAEEDTPPEYLVIKFSRRLESYWMLLWVLSFVKNLEKPNNFAPAEYANKLLESRSPEQFMLDAALRNTVEILDTADLYYRYHWALNEALLYGRKPPRGLEPDVVYERHYALNWLIGYQEQAWDDVMTDT